MKGAKGGKRDRIISWLFSRKNQKEKKELEIETKEGTEKKEKKIDIIKEELILDNEDIKTNEPLKSKVITQNNDTKTINIQNTVSLETRETIDVLNPSKKVEFIEDNVQNKESSLESNLESNLGSIESLENIDEISNSDKNNTINSIEELESVEISEPTNVIQFAVFEELEKMIKDDYYEIQEIKYELDVLTRNEKDKVLTDEVEELQSKLESLIKRFEEIKKRYEYIYSTKDFDNVNNLQDNYISGIINEYKDSIKTDEQIENFVNEIKFIEEYINVINIIIDVENDKDSLKNNIDEKLDKYEIRDIEFEELKEKYVDIEKINEILNAFNKNQDYIVKDLEDKIQETIDIKNKMIKTTKLVPNFNKLFQAALMVAASKKIPPTPVGNMLKANILINSIVVASHFIEKKEDIKENRTITYTDYEKDINKAISNVNNVIVNIDNTLLNLKDMKETFKQNFSEFASQIPEYAEMMKNLEDIEKELVCKQTTIIKYNENFNKILDDNNTKIKKIEDDM